ncbi:MAG TPA: hypothetical protein VM900_04320 [Sphingomonas sp.]|jgi:hypothetical protein|nr:hypothetical protein [Sphingomonas sp.]
MRNSTSIVLAVAAAIGLGSTARAEPPATLAPFAGSPLSDADLSVIRGSGLPFAGPTRRQVVGLTDLQSQFDVRSFGTVARIQMDVWWGSEGAGLIASAVRAQLPDR